MFKCDNCGNKFIKPNKSTLYLNMRTCIYCVCTRCGSRYIHKVPNKCPNMLDWMKNNGLMK